MGVDAAQGYLLARPTTDRGAITHWLEDGLLSSEP
jgi:EAL domain-containing protein (putative c-di-GMP-specific phosphodiesterase class I)